MKKEPLPLLKVDFFFQSRFSTAFRLAPPSFYFRMMRSNPPMPFHAESILPLSPADRRPLSFCYATARRARVEFALLFFLPLPFGS